VPGVPGSECWSLPSSPRFSLWCSAPSSGHIRSTALPRALLRSAPLSHSPSGSDGFNLRVGGFVSSLRAACGAQGLCRPEAQGLVDVPLHRLVVDLLVASWPPAPAQRRRCARALVHRVRLPHSPDACYPRLGLLLLVSDAGKERENGIRRVSEGSTVRSDARANHLTIGPYRGKIPSHRYYGERTFALSNTSGTARYLTLSSASQLRGNGSRSGCCTSG
jgi:hypothetical protein